MKINRDELSGLLIPDFSLDKNGERIINIIEDKKYKISVNSKMSVDIYDITEKEKILKTIPKTFSSELKSEINFMKKEIKNIVKREREKILMLLMNGRKLSYDFWKKIYIDNSFLSQYSVNLFWNLYDENENCINIFRYLGDGSFIDINDDYITLNENNLISLASPTEINKDSIIKSINQLSDYEIAQPIKQIQIIDDLEDEFNKYNSITVTVSNIKNFASQFAFKEFSEYYEEFNGY